MSRLIQIQFEGSTQCNANCVFCPRSDMTRPKGTMSDDLFHKIIREGKEMGVKSFIPFLNGEPFANPKIFDWLDFMEKEGVSTCIFTNAGLLDKEKIDRLVKYSNIDKVVCSFNGATEETYKKIMRGPDYKKTKENIEYLIDSAPFNVIVSMVVVNDDIHENKQFRKMWGRHATSVPFINWAGSKHDPTEKIGPQKACNQVLGQMNILWDGRVCLCCMDFDGKVILGDVNRQSLQEIWKNARSIREKHRQKNFNMPLCVDCNKNVQKIESVYKNI